LFLGIVDVVGREKEVNFIDIHWEGETGVFGYVSGNGEGRKKRAVNV